MSQRSLKRKNKKLVQGGFNLFASEDAPSTSKCESQKNHLIESPDECRAMPFDDDYGADGHQQNCNLDDLLAEDFLVFDDQPDDPALDKELSKMKQILDFVEMEEENADFNPVSFLETPADEFLFGYLKLIVQDGVTWTHMDNVLKLLQKTLLPWNKTSHATILKKYAKQHLDYDYQIKCGCGKLIFVKKNDCSNELRCDKCNARIQFKEFIKEHDHTCVFSIKDQLRNISKVTKQIKELPRTRDEPLQLDLLLTLDGCPLSDSSKQSLYPMILYVDNFKTKYLMDKFPVHKTLTIFTRKSKQDNYDQVITPLLNELSEISNEGFETSWSKRTTVKIKMIIGDSKVRAALMNFLQHNGKFPCHRCYIEFDPKFLFPCHPSNELVLRQTADIPECIEELKRLQANAKTKTKKKELSNFKGVKGPSLLASLELDLVNCVIVDVMHLVFLGVCRLFVTQFFEDATQTVEITSPNQPKRTKKIRSPYYLDNDCKEVLNNRLSLIKTPSSISRPFRSLLEIANFKSKEFENFLFFTSYFTLIDVLEEPFFGHFMLLNSAVHKLYSKTASAADVEKAKFEIDLFMTTLNELDYSEAFFKYNCHCLPHLYEDRVNFGEPLSRYNAYGYENELQFDKHCSKSKNKTVESIANKIVLRSMFQMHTNEPKDELLEKDRVHLNPNAVPVKAIVNQLRISSSAGLKFYQKAKIYNRRIRIRGSNKVEDSFVKIGDQYYQVTLIFKHDEQAMILCEKIPVSRPAVHDLKGYSIKLDHLKIIDLEGWKEKTNFVFKLDQIKCHCLYVRIDDVLPHRYIVDLEV